MSDALWNIPKTWIWTEMKDLGKIISGGTPSTKEPAYWGDEVNWISPSDLTGYNNKTIIKGAKNLTLAGLKNSSAKMMPAGSVHFSSRAPIGYVAISSQPLCTNQGFKSLVPSDGVFNEYAYYYLKASKYLAEERATGTTFKEISGTAFGKLPFPLPPSNEQKRIVAKIEELFSELDSGIESLKTAREQLKVYRQAVLKHAFEGKLTATWRAQQDVKSADWKRVKLDALGIVICGQSPSVAEVNQEGKGILYVTGPEQWNGSHIEEVKWTEHPKKIAPDGSIFITVKGAGVGKLFPGTKCAIGRDVYAFCPNDLASTEFIIYALRYSIDQVVLQAKGDIPGLSKNHILDHIIGLPSKEEQAIVVQRLDQVFSSTNQMEKEISLQLQKSEALRQSILKKAFSGQLVAQNAADEPASTLLERIRSEKLIPKTTIRKPKEKSKVA